MPSKARGRRSSMISRKSKSRSQANGSRGSSQPLKSSIPDSEQKRDYTSYLASGLGVILVTLLLLFFSGFFSSDSTSNSPTGQGSDSSIADNKGGVMLNKFVNLNYHNLLKFEAKILDEWVHHTSDFTQGLQYIPYNIISKYNSIHSKLVANSIYQTQHNSEPDMNNVAKNFHKEKNGVLIESTGLYGKSKLQYLVPYSTPRGQKDDPEARKLHSVSMHKKLFGEGVTLFWNSPEAVEAASKSAEAGEDALEQQKEAKKQEMKLIALTWREGKVLEYDMELGLISDSNLILPHAMKEGWGLYFDGDSEQFVATDGTDKLFFIDYDGFRVRKKMSVQIAQSRDKTKFARLDRLNEIEMVNGWILANVWFKKYIAVISPINGYVYATIDCANLVPADNVRNRDAVLNGVAYNPDLRHLIVTGKLWSKMYAIELPEFVLSVTPSDVQNAADK